MDFHDQRNALDPSDRRDVADKIEIEPLIERNVDGVLRVYQQQRVTVGRHAAHRFSCDVAGGARTNLDDELLAEFFRKELGNQARDEVGSAARRLSDNDFHWTRRIGLRPRNRRSDRQRGSTGSQMQEVSTVGKFHGVLPRRAAWRKAALAEGYKDCRRPASVGRSNLCAGAPTSNMNSVSALKRCSRFAYRTS